MRPIAFGVVRGTTLLAPLRPTSLLVVHRIDDVLWEEGKVQLVVAALSDRRLHGIAPTGGQ